MANGSGTGRISEEKAALVLDRAARIDAGHGKWLDVSELREAALEAGISLEAFERALLEIEAMEEGAVPTEVSVPAPGLPAESAGRRTARRTRDSSTGFPSRTSTDAPRSCSRGSSSWGVSRG
jgi:hypothetical protein